MFIIEKEPDCKLDDVIRGNIERLTRISIKHYFGVCFSTHSTKINKEIRTYDIHTRIDRHRNG